jgi:hypothetical protein
MIHEMAFHSWDEGCLFMFMPTPNIEFASRDVNIYKELWDADHKEVMACFSLESKLSRGVAIFDFITHIDESYRKAVLGGEAEFQPELFDAIAKLYQVWKIPCDEALKELAKFEQNYTVAGADEFRRRCREVVGICTPDSEFFSSEAMITLRDEAIEEHERGETIDAT